MEKINLEEKLEGLLFEKFSLEEARHFLGFSELLGGEHLEYLAHQETWKFCDEILVQIFGVKKQDIIWYVLGKKVSLFDGLELLENYTHHRKDLVLLKENLDKLRRILEKKIEEFMEEDPKNSDARWIATIDFQGKGRNGLEFLVSGTTLVGALAPCHFRLDDSEVSGVHARFIFSERTGSCWVEDLRSTNGTYLLQETRKIRLSMPTEVEERDYLLTYPQELEDGDRLLFGDTYAVISIRKIK